MLNIQKWEDLQVVLVDKLRSHWGGGGLLFYFFKQEKVEIISLVDNHMLSLDNTKKHPENAIQNVLL